MGNNRRLTAGYDKPVSIDGARDVIIPAKAVPNAPLSRTPGGVYTLPDSTVAYFTAEALADIPAMHAVALGDGGVLPFTAATSEDLPMAAVSENAVTAGDKGVFTVRGSFAAPAELEDGKRVFVLADGSLTTTGTKGAQVVGYTENGSCVFHMGGSGSGGGGSVSISEKEGNIITQEPDGLYAAQEVSDASSNLAMLAGDGIFVPGEAIMRAVGDILEMPAGIKDPALLPMSSYHSVLRDETTKVVEDLYGNWWFAYAEEELLVELPAMTSNTEPAPLVAATSSVLAATTQPYIAFDKVNESSASWHTLNAANQWISLDFGKEMAIRAFSWFTRLNNSPDITPNTVTVTCEDSAGDTVFTGDYTGFNHTAGQSATFQLKPGTTTPVNATIGVVKNVRKITILNKQSMYTGSSEIPLIVYDNEKMPDVTTHFVTEKRPHAVKGMEYYLVIKPWADKTTPIVLSTEPGNTLNKKPDGLYSAGAQISDDTGNAIETREDGLFVQALEQYLEPGELYVGRKGLVHPNIISMSNYNILKKDDNPDVLAAFGNWWYKYLQEEALYKLPPMTSNTAPAPLVAAASSVYSGGQAWNAFDQAAGETIWHSNQGTNQWISLDLGKEYTMQQFSWWNRAYASPVGNPTSAVLTLWDDFDAVVLQKTYTGFSTAALGKTDIPLLPGTTTDKDATIGVVKNVRKLRIQVPANQYVIAKEIPIIIYENDKVPDLATEFVTPKRIYPTDDKEYFIVLKTIKILPDGTIAGGVKDVTISPDAGNIADMRGNGLFVPDTRVSADPGNAIETREDGVFVPGGGSAVVSPDTGNAIEQRANGLFVEEAAIGTLVPAPSVRIGTVTKSNEKYDGRWVYYVTVETQLTNGTQKDTSIASVVPGTLLDGGIATTFSYVMNASVGNRRTTEVPSAWATWFSPSTKTVSIQSTGDRTAYKALLTVWFTYANEAQVFNDGIATGIRLSAEDGNAASNKPDGLFVGKNQMSDAELWLERNPDKTLDDYLELFRQILPIVQYREGVVVRTSRRYNGRSVYAVVLPVFAMGGAAKEVYADIPGFPVGNVADAGIDHDNSYMYPTATPANKLSCVNNYWYTSVYTDTGKAGVYSFNDRTTWSARLCVWWTRKDEEPNFDIAGVDVSGNAYVRGEKGDSAMTVSKQPLNATVVLPDGMFTPQMGSMNIVRRANLTMLPTSTSDARLLNVSTEQHILSVDKYADVMMRLLGSTSDYLKDEAPFMTGPSSPTGYTLTGSAQYTSAPFAPWKCRSGLPDANIDGNHTLSNTSTQLYVTQTFPEPVTIERMAITNRASVAYVLPPATMTAALYDANDKVLFTKAYVCATGSGQTTNMHVAFDNGGVPIEGVSKITLRNSTSAQAGIVVWSIILADVGKFKTPIIPCAVPGNSWFIALEDVGIGDTVVDISPDAGNIIESRASGLYATGAQVPDIQVNAVTKMPYKVDGKQVYAFKLTPFVGPASSAFYALPAGIPTFNAAWVDMQNSHYLRTTHSTTLHDSMPACGTTWYTGIQIPERKLYIGCSGSMAAVTAHIVILFTTPSGE